MLIMWAGLNSPHKPSHHSSLTSLFVGEFIIANANESRLFCEYRFSQSETAYKNQNILKRNVKSVIRATARAAEARYKQVWKGRGGSALTASSIAMPARQATKRQTRSPGELPLSNALRLNPFGYKRCRQTPPPRADKKCRSRTSETRLGLLI